MWHNFAVIRVAIGFLCLLFYSRCSFVQEIDPRLNPFVEEFVKDAKKYNVDVNTKIISSLSYGNITGPFNLMDDAVGVCLPLVFGPVSLPIPKSSKIIIEPAFPYNSCSFKALVYHELAHCLLSEPHSESDTLMSAYMTNENFYCQNWDALLEELFTGKETSKVDFYQEDKMLGGFH